MKVQFLVAPIVALALAGCASARPPAPEAVAPLSVVKSDAAMPFANYSSSIRNWLVREDGSLLVEAMGGKWYHATVRGACPWLDMATAVGFKVGATGTLDRFSSVLVEGHECHFDSFDEVADPKPPKAG